MASSPMDGLTSGSLLVLVSTFLVTHLLMNRLVKSKLLDHFNHVGKALPLPPSLSSLPVFGSLLHFMGKVETLPDFFTEAGMRLGKVFSLYAGSKYMIVVNGREAIQEALVDRGCDFANRTCFLALRLSDPHSKSIVFRNYADIKHTRRRALKILKRFGFGASIVETRILVELKSMIAWIRELNGKEFDPRHLAAIAMSSVGTNILFGRRFSYNDPVFLQALEDIHFGIMKVLIDRIQCLNHRKLPGVRMLKANIRVLGVRDIRLVINNFDHTCLIWAF